LIGQIDSKVDWWLKIVFKNLSGAFLSLLMSETSRNSITYLNKLKSLKVAQSKDDYGCWMMV